MRNRARSARVGSALDNAIRDIQDNCFALDNERMDMEQRVAQIEEEIMTLKGM